MFTPVQARATDAGLTTTYRSQPSPAPRSLLDAESLRQGDDEVQLSPAALTQDNEAQGNGSALLDLDATQDRGNTLYSKVSGEALDASGEAQNENSIEREDEEDKGPFGLDGDDPYNLEENDEDDDDESSSPFGLEDRAAKAAEDPFGLREKSERNADPFGLSPKEDALPQTEVRVQFGPAPQFNEFGILSREEETERLIPGWFGTDPQSSDSSLSLADRLAAQRAAKQELEAEREDAIEARPLGFAPGTSLRVVGPPSRALPVETQGLRAEAGAFGVSASEDFRATTELSGPFGSTGRVARLISAYLQQGGQSASAYENGEIISTLG